MTPAELVTRLGDGTFLVRTGVALVPPQKVPTYEILALQWGAEPIDLIQLRLERLPDGTRFFGLGPETFLTDLDAVARSRRRTRCALVANADLLLARLADEERPRVWEFLFSSFKKRPTALLLLMPDGAEHLFSSAEADRWNRAGRLYRLVGNGTEGATQYEYVKQEVSGNAD